MSFIYLDDDEIPEIVMHCYDDAWEGLDIYTYYDGEARHLDTYDMNGDTEMNPEFSLTSNGRQGMGDSYCDRYGMLFQRGGMMGCFWVNGYILENGRLDRAFEYFYTDTTDWAKDADPVSYEIRYKLKDGTVVDVNKEEDVYFEECEELRDIEREYDFSFDSLTDLHGDNLLTYEEVRGCLYAR